MTKKQIKEFYNDNLNLGDERVVDVDIWADPFAPDEKYATIITISRYHEVRKILLKEHNNTMILAKKSRID